MKTKKLALNKQTIANLNKNEMNEINGGATTFWWRAATIVAGLVMATHEMIDHDGVEVTGVITVDLTCEWSCEGYCA